jgi:hypothetical protein
MTATPRPGRSYSRPPEWITCTACKGKVTSQAARRPRPLHRQKRTLPSRRAYSSVLHGLLLSPSTRQRSCLVPPTAPHQDPGNEPLAYPEGRPSERPANAAHATHGTLPTQSPGTLTYRAIYAPQRGFRLLDPLAGHLQILLIHRPPAYPHRHLVHTSVLSPLTGET